MNEQQEYPGTERRAERRSIAEVEAAFDRKLKVHADEERAWIKQYVENTLLVAFPDGPEKHREYHQSIINAAQEQAEFWKLAKLKLVENGVSAFFAVMRWVIILALVGLAYQLGLGPLVAKFMKP